MSDGRQSGTNQTGSQNMEQGQLRQRIDSGQTGDKVPVEDPATAPLGTDDEAAGHRSPAGGGSAALGAPSTVGSGMSESPTGGGASGGRHGAGSLAGTTASGRPTTPGAVASQSDRLDRRPPTRNWWIIVAAFVIVLLVVLYAFGVTWPTSGFRN